MEVVPVHHRTNGQKYRVRAEKGLLPPAVSSHAWFSDSHVVEILSYVGHLEILGDILLSQLVGEDAGLVGRDQGWCSKSCKAQVSSCETVTQPGISVVLRLRKLVPVIVREGTDGHLVLEN